MKRRLKTFQMFKESYLNEYEDDVMPTDLEDGSEHIEDAPAEEAPVEDMPAEDDAPISDDIEGGSEEDAEKDALKDKIKSVIDANYLDTLSDLVKGITGELEDTEDEAKVIDALLDVIEERTEEILMGSDEEEINLEDESGEDMPLDDEIPAEVPAEAPISDEEAPAPAPEMTEEEEAAKPAEEAPKTEDAIAEEEEIATNEEENK